MGVVPSTQSSTQSSTDSAGSGGLDGFHPAVATWFARRFPDGPSLPQEQGWPLIARAPTPSSRRRPGRARPWPDSSSPSTPPIAPRSAARTWGAASAVVYVSPLKALAVDIHQNLERPLAEIAEVARELGLAVPL